MSGELKSLPKFEPGYVWLAGAGPGDPGLITLLAMHGLKNAEVIFYDSLINRSLLEYADKKARLEFVGKKVGKCVRTQEQINRMLVEAAKQNKRVLRLKGGDPMVFSRGGEELEALKAAGVKFRIIPGVSAATAACAYAGIPITRRGYNSSITLVTGHDAKGKLPSEINWRALVAADQPIIFFMSLRHLDEISRRLVEAGMKTDEKVILIADGTLSRQKVFECRLAEMAECYRRNKIESPALVVMGRINELGRVYDWFDPESVVGDFSRT